MPDRVIKTAWKVSKYRFFSGPNTGKDGPEKTSYLDTFHAVKYTYKAGSRNYSFFSKFRRKQNKCIERKKIKKKTTIMLEPLDWVLKVKDLTIERIW